jgi:RNA polymerase sigma factor (sigma-70 family)
MNYLSDEQLIAEYLKGKDHALEFLIQKNLRMVYNFVCRYVRQKDEAEDLTQEVFVKVWKNIKKYKADYKFKTWVLAVARNVCLDFFKKKNQPMPFSELENEENGVVFADTLADRTPSVLEMLKRREAAKELSFAVEELPPAYRQTLDLRYQDDFKFREIAELLKEPLDTVKTRHRRAIEALKKIFSR